MNKKILIITSLLIAFTGCSADYPEEPNADDFHGFEFSHTTITL